MATTNNKISATKIDIYDKLLSIARLNFPDYDNYDFMRSGAFGWMIESMAMSIRDNALYKTMLYNESFLNLAVMPKSIYSRAKMFNVNVITASPASATMLFQIEVESLRNKIDNSSINTSEISTKYGISNYSKGIILDKTNPIIAGNYYFSLEHSILITKVENQNDSSTFLVQYLVNEQNVTTEYGNYTNSILPISIVEYNGVQYLLFSAIAYQYKIVTTEKILTSTNFISSRVYNFTFEDQLAGLSMKYQRGNNAAENIELYFNNMSKPADENIKYAYYNLVDTNELEVIFVQSAAGIPQNGGTLTLNLLETKGAEGNISFNSTALFSINDNESLRDLPISVTFAEGVSYGGTNAPSLEEIKSLIVEELSTRNTIITESDLNKFFKKNAAILSDINGSTVEFVKDRDDILKRSFNAYLMLRNGNATETNKYENLIVPTNTIDIVYTPTEIIDTSTSSNGITSIEIDQSYSIGYDDATKKYVASNSTSSPTPNINEDLTYSVPFFLQVQLYPFKKTHYIYTATNDTAQLQLTNVRSLSSVFIPSTCNIYKDINDQRGNYTVTFNVVTDLNLEEGFASNSSDSLATLIIYRSSGGFDTRAINSEDITATPISTNSDDETLVQYQITVLLCPPDGNEALFDFANESSAIKLKVGENGTSYAYPNKVRLGLQLNGNIGKFINVTFVSKTYLTLFEELDDVMSSDIEMSAEVTEVEGSANQYKISSVTIKSVPVVLSRRLRSQTEDRELFIKQLLIYINFLRENTSKLESNTFFNLKFFNTYGISYLYDTITTNIRLQLDIFFKEDIDDSLKQDLAKQIRQFIRTVVEQGNDNHRLKVSDVIAYTTATYNDYIDHIDFNGLNGTFNQYIRQVQTTTNNSTKYPLEYFNLDTATVSNNDNTSRIMQDIRFFDFNGVEPIVEEEN